MKKTVLILTYSGDDEHVARVTEELRRCGVRALAFQTDLYPTRRRPSIAIDDDDFTFSLQLGRHKVSSSSQLIGIWNRRLRDPQMSVALRSSANRAAALLDCQRFLEGLWQILEGCNWFSGTPEATRRADSKILQLQVATSMLSRYPSMHVPDTRIIVQPKQLIEFWERCAGEVLFKGLGVLAPEVGRDIYTVRLTSDFNAGSVRYAPGIYQKLVPKTFDVRVTVVGERVFACAIRSQESGVLDALVDWRRDPNVQMEAYQLPIEVEKFCLEFVAQMGLRGGALDLILAPDGSWWFLEINPSGQFGFVEVRTGLPISAAVAEVLIAS